MTTEKMAPARQPAHPDRRPGLRLGALIGSGDRIGAFVLPFVLAGVTQALATAGLVAETMIGHGDAALG